MVSDVVALLRNSVVALMVRPMLKAAISKAVILCHLCHHLMSVVLPKIVVKVGILLLAGFTIWNMEVVRGSGMVGPVVTETTFWTENPVMKFVSNLLVKMLVNCPGWLDPVRGIIHDGDLMPKPSLVNNSFMADAWETTTSMKARMNARPFALRILRFPCF